MFSENLVFTTRRKLLHTIANTIQYGVYVHRTHIHTVTKAMINVIPKTNRILTFGSSSIPCGNSFDFDFEI